MLSFLVLASRDFSKESKYYGPCSRPRPGMGDLLLAGQTEGHPSTVRAGQFEMHSLLQEFANSEERYPQPFSIPGRQNPQFKAEEALCSKCTFSPHCLTVVQGGLLWSDVSKVC